MSVRIVACLALVAVLLVGCISVPGSGPAVVGQGPVVTEDRQVQAFTTVEIKNGIKLELSVGDTTSVQVMAQQNIVPLISTTVANGRLTAQTTGSVVTTQPLVVHVVTPSLNALSMSGGAYAEVGGVTSQAFSLDADSGANANIAGATDTLTINAKNGALLQLDGFAARDINLTAQNGVTGTINASGTVTGSASDGVLLSVSGGATVNVSTSAGAIVTSR
jgi:hypothetical protein